MKTVCTSCMSCIFKKLGIPRLPIPAWRVTCEVKGFPHKGLLATKLQYLDTSRHHDAESGVEKKKFITMTNSFNYFC